MLLSPKKMSYFFYHSYVLFTSQPQETPSWRERAEKVFIIHVIKN